MSEPQSRTMSSGEFDLSQFHDVFFEEAGDNLASMESLLLALDIEQVDDETLNAIFRCAHSIKGGAATFGFQDVADLTHVMETLLDRLRRHELSITVGMVDTLLESGDVLRQLLAIRQSGSGEAIEVSELVARIRALAQGDAAAPPLAVAPRVAAPEAPAVIATQAPADAVVQPVPESSRDEGAEAVSDAMGGASLAAGERLLEVVVGPLEQPRLADDLADLFSEIPGLGSISPLDDGQLDAQRMRRFRVVTSASDGDLLDLFTFHVAREQVQITTVQSDTPDAPAEVAAAQVETTAEDGSWGLFDTASKAGQPDAESAPAEATPRADSGSPPASVVAATPATVAAVPSVPAAGAAVSQARSTDKSQGANLESSTIRVPIEKVDQLINLVGELVITQAMLAQTGQHLDTMEHQRMVAGLTDLERNTRMLQEAVMAIRMIPMTAVFNRFPRMLRDLAGKLGKKLELHTIGEDTELDKGLIEKITDPLTHLVRNAADHGIEMPEDRLAAGKPEIGTVTLAAAHQGGSIVIEVRDDGRGLNRGKLLRKAAERGLQVSESMSDQEVYGLIFEPGFSTAAEVTDVSGRGVGMDVVKRNITALGGSVEIDSTEGQGMRVSVRLPLTLAIMDGMSVGVGDETYIVPLASVIESIHLAESDVKSVGGSGRLVQVRQEYLPLMQLDQLFDVPRQTAQEGGIMIVVEAEGGRVALLVDELIGQHQVVVKNLEANYRKVPGVSGATILGDGRVALILDVSWLVRRARH
ncbi:MAG: chemotaxis protein CheW [Burkholderiaceae bacterium]